MSQPEFLSSSRRWFIGAATAVLCSAAGAARKQQGIVERLAAIRSRIGGRLGVYVLNTHTGRQFGIDDEGRFAMASTFKWLLAAAILAKVERAELRFEQRVAFTEKDMLPHAPVTSKHLQQGSLTLRELCAAVVEVSDNPALITPCCAFYPGRHVKSRWVSAVFSAAVPLSMKNADHRPRASSHVGRMVLLANAWAAALLTVAASCCAVGTVVTELWERLSGRSNVYSATMSPVTALTACRRWAIRETLQSKLAHLRFGSIGRPFPCSCNSRDFVA